jgi:kynurenine formamidase
MITLRSILALSLLLAGCAPADQNAGRNDVPAEPGAAAAGSAAERAAVSEQAKPAGPAGPAVDLEGYDLVDLTHTFDENTIYWPTSPHGFELEQLSYGKDESGRFYAANSFCAPEHGGTHLDAPIHFAEGQQTADTVPLDRLIGPAVVIDVSEQAAADADYLLTADDVTAWEAEHGEIPKGSIVLLYTGWGKKYADRAAYLGDDTPGDATNLHFPAYGEDAAELLVGARQAAVLGLDTASLDHGPSTDFKTHRVAAARNVPGLENLANLDRLPATGAWVIALPVKIGGGTGGPVRVVALVPGS